MKLLVVLTLVIVLSSCATDTETSKIVLKDRGGENGVDFEYVSGMSQNFNLPEIMGGGVALFDSDMDGDMDLYFVQGGSLDQKSDATSGALYINDGRGEFELVDADEASTALGYGMGVTAGDVDGDGLPDLFITQFGTNVLLRNVGANRYEDFTREAGFIRDEWTTAAAFADFDVDGDLDLWLVNYVEWRESIEIECYQTMLGSRDYCSPTHYNRPSQDRIYWNDGTGRFTDATESAGLKGKTGNGLGNVVGDFNNDGLLDVYVANDLTPNQLWINLGDRTFIEEATIRNAAVDLHGVSRAGMGVAAFDLDDDLDQDLMVVHITTESNYLFRNDGDYFTDVASSVGINIASQRYTRFGLVVADLNNDSWLDIFEANGAVSRLSNPEGDDLFAEPNAIYIGNSNRRYGQPVYGEVRQTSRGAAYGDLNADGLLDIVVVNRDSSSNVLINESKGGNWLLFDLRDKAGGVAIGAKVSLRLGDRNLSRMVITSGSYLASNDPRVHFGLGEHEAASEVTIEWLSGGVTKLDLLEANQLVRLQEE